MANKDNADRREFERADLELAIRFRDRRNLKGEYIRNISYGGVFVCTKYPMPNGSSVELTLEAPDGKTMLTKGVVVWSSADSTDPSGTPSQDKRVGMGIKFAGKKKELAKVREFIDQILIDPA